MEAKKTISDLDFEKFIELVHLLDFTDEENEHSAVTTIVDRLSRFIGNIPADDAIILGNAVQDIQNNEMEAAEEEYNYFKLKNPELEYNPEGTLGFSPIRYFELSLQTVERAYERAEEVLAKNPHDISSEKPFTQIKDARTLLPLLRMKGSYEYPIKKNMYFKNKIPVVEEEELAAMVFELKELLGEEQKVAAKFINYIYNKNPNRVYHFVEHFITRIHVLYLDKDLEYEVNKEFLETLKKVA